MPIPNGVTNSAVSFGEASNVKAVGRAITVTAAQLTLNATFDIAVVPEGFTVTHVEFRSTDIDSGGSPAVILALGDAADDDRLISGATIGQATANRTDALAATGFLYRYPAQTTIQAKVTTAPATAAAGTISAIIFGVLD